MTKPIQITKEMSNKLANMSLICAFLVVCRHTSISGEMGSFYWWINSFLHDGISTVAVPFFFLCSAFLLAGHMHEDAWYKREMSKRIMSLLTPYVFWNLLAFVYGTLWIMGCNLWADRPLLTALGFDGTRLSRIFGLHPYYGPEIGPLWFVRCLLIFVLISPLLKCLANPLGLLVLLVIYGVFAPWGDRMIGVPKTFWTMFFSLEGLYYFTLGIYLRFCSRCIRVRLSVIIASAGVFLMLNGLGELWGCELMKYFRWLAIPFLLYVLWHLMPSGSWPHILVSAAFPVYVLHLLLKSPALLMRLTGIKDALLYAMLMIGLRLLLPILIVSCLRCVAGERMNKVMWGGR